MRNIPKLKLGLIAVSRDCFPDLYVQAVAELHDGCSAEHINEAVVVVALDDFVALALGGDQEHVCRRQ